MKLCIEGGGFVIVLNWHDTFSNCSITLYIEIDLRVMRPLLLPPFSSLTPFISINNAGCKLLHLEIK